MNLFIQKNKSFKRVKNILLTGKFSFFIGSITPSKTSQVNGDKKLDFVECLLTVKNALTVYSICFVLKDIYF